MSERPASEPVSGHDLSLLTPSDAAVAARSYGRRFRELIARLDDEPDLRARAEALAGVAAQALGDAARRIDPGAPPGQVGDAPVDALAAAGEALAAAIGKIRDWGDREGGDRLEVVRGAVRAGSERLREAEHLAPDDDP